MRNLFTVFALFFPFAILAQTVTVSEPLSLRNDQAYELIGKLKDRFLLYRDRSNNDYEIQAFDENLQLSWNKALEFEKKKTDVIGLVPSQDDFNIIYRFKNKGDYLLKINKYDPGANLVDSALIWNYNNKFYPPNVNMVYSEDRSKVLLYSVEKNSIIEAMCFDVEQMNLLWTNKFEPEGMIYHVDYQQPLITNSGKMYYVFGKDNRRSNRYEHLYIVYTADASTAKGQLSTFTIPMEEKLTFDVLFEYDNLNKRILAGGLYSEKNKGRALGYFYLRINPDNSDNYLLKFHVFDDKLVSDFLGKPVKVNKGIPETEIKDIVLRRDAGIIILAERNKLLERQMLSGARSSYVGDDGRGYIVDYHFEDIMALSVHPDGAPHWAKIMPKRQYSQDDDAIYSSFFLLKTPSSLRLIFNDEIKYENTVSEYVLRGNGEYDRNSVLSTAYQKLQLRFQDALQVSSKSLIIPSERRSRLRLVKLEY